MNMRVDSQDAGNYHQVSLEIGKDELKKQSEQARRLGNDGYRNHSQVGRVKNAVQSLQPEQLLAVLKNTQQALVGNGAKMAINGQEMPELRSPQGGDAKTLASGDGHRSSAAVQTELLGKITQLMDNTSLEKMLSQLNSFNAMMSGAASDWSEMAAMLEQQGTQWAADSDALKAAQQQADGLSDDVDTAQKALDSAQAELNYLKMMQAAQDENHLDTWPRDDLQKQIDRAQAEVTGVKLALTIAKGLYNGFVEKTLDPAKIAESNSRMALEATQTRARTLVNTITPQQQSAVELQRKFNDDQSKSLTFLMALMSQLIAKSSSDDLEATAELKQKLAEASAKDAEKKAKEYEEEVRKSEEMQKTMGCIGKILGWLITAVSFVAAAFTGGASLALAAVGLALAIGDEIDQAVTGNSFMADAMKPLMDAIVKPLMELMGKMFTGILEAMGVDKATAEMVGKIMGAIAAAVVLIVGVIVAGSALSKVFGAIMTKIGLEVGEEASKTMGKSVAAEVEEEVTQDLAKTTLRTAAEEVTEEAAKEVTEQTTKTTMQRLMDSAFAQAFKRVFQGFGRAAGMDEVKMGTIYNRTQMAVTGAEVVNTSIQAAGGIVVADMMVEASKAKAQMMKDAALQELLNEMMDRTIDAFSHRMETVNQIVKNISSVADTQLQTGRYITKQMSSVAG